MEWAIVSGHVFYFVDALRCVNSAEQNMAAYNAHWSRSGQNCSKIIFSLNSTYNGPNNYKNVFV